MDSDHVLVLFLGLVLVGAAVALAYTSPAVFGGESDGVGGASLTSFETADAYCGDPNTTSGSTFTRDAPAGEALVINQSVPVPTNDTTVSASLEEFGPRRYILAVTRETPERTPTETPTPEPDTATPTAGNESQTTEANATRANETATDAANETADANETATETPTPTPSPTPTETVEPCHPEVRYNATIEVSHPEDYTVIVTYDGEFVTAYWGEGDDSGSHKTLPDQPETADGENETAAMRARGRATP
jgi:hypothetical protein